jgi:hypothetical protein
MTRSVKKIRVPASSEDAAAILRAGLSPASFWSPEIAWKRARSVDVPKSILAIDGARDILKWVPRTPFEKGLERMAGTSLDEPGHDDERWSA